VVNLAVVGEWIVNLIMAGEKATSSAVSVGDFNPGGLAIGAVQWRHGGRIEVDQVQLLTAMRVMAGITSSALVGMRPV